MGIKTVFQEGLKEQRRRRALGREKRGLREKEKVAGEQLTALGRRAWEGKIEISAFGDMQARLAEAQTRIAELRSRLDKLRGQRQDAADTKKKMAADFTANLKGVETKKKEVDGKLVHEKGDLKRVQKELEQSNVRLAAVPREREHFKKRGAAANVTEAEKSEIEKKMTALAGEEKELQAQTQEKAAAAKVLNEKIAPLQEDAAQLQKQIDEICAEQKKVLGEFDKTLLQLDKECGDYESKLKEAENGQSSNFRSLGEKLAAAKSADPAIAAEMAALRASEKEKAEIGVRMGSLESQRSAAGDSAYRKMLALLFAGIILLAVLIFVLTKIF